MSERSRAAEGEAPRQMLNVKIRGELRGKLDRAAKNRGRTLSREVEQRLEDSFGASEVGSQAQFMACVRGVLEEVEKETGQSFTERDGDLARTMTRRALEKLVEYWCGPDTGESDGYESGLREDGAPHIPNYSFSANIAFQVMRQERLFRPAPGGGLLVRVGPGSFDDPKDDANSP